MHNGKVWLKHIILSADVSSQYVCCVFVSSDGITILPLQHQHNDLAVMLQAVFLFLGLLWTQYFGTVGRRIRPFDLLKLSLLSYLGDSSKLTG